MKILQLSMILNDKYNEKINKLKDVKQCIVSSVITHSIKTIHITIQ